MSGWGPFEFALCKGIDGLEGLDLARYVQEPKLDGIRVQAVLVDGQVRVYTRTHHNATGKLVAVEAVLRDFVQDLDRTVLDGEAVYLDDNGRADFNFTARVMGSHPPKAVAKQRAESQYLSLMAFDLLWLKGVDTRKLTFKHRRMLLEQLVEGLDSYHIVSTPQAPCSEKQHREYTGLYGEGSVVKELQAPYREGRSSAMLKWKKVADEDVVIMGAEPGKGKFLGQVGAVRFGQYVDGELVYRGKCSGMDDLTRRRISKQLPVGAVLVVTHNGVLANGGFRHPQWSHLRDDKAPEECVWT